MILGRKKTPTPKKGGGCYARRPEVALDHYPVTTNLLDYLFTACASVPDAGGVLLDAMPPSRLVSTPSSGPPLARLGIITSGRSCAFPEFFRFVSGHKIIVPPTHRVEAWVVEF